MTGGNADAAFEIRAARRADVPAIHGMIRALAAYENLADICVATESDLEHVVAAAWNWTARRE